MLLYFASARPVIREAGQVLPCPSRACKQAGRTYPHLCFSTEPLAGLGEWLFSIDVSPNLVAPYEYAANFRAEQQARLFAIPHEVLLNPDIEIRRDRFEEVTGNPWNTWLITVLDKRGNRAKKLLGAWALIWMSGEGIASARVNKKSPDGKLLTLEVTTSKDFDPEVDYIVVEHHEEIEKDHGIKETWFLETYAGITPQWVIFPKAWEQWVFSPEVTESAVRFLMENMPSLRHDIEFAHTRDSKHNKARAWRLVADNMGAELSRQAGRSVTLGKLAAHSWTAVEAMPKRIAKRLGSNIRKHWEPPLPEPAFEHPDSSGRVLLANLYGAYPKMGPGVDHSPQDRPYQKIEGELGDDTPFAGSRKVSASLPV